MKIASVEEMQKLDRDAIEQYGITEAILMENAGLAVYQVTSQHFAIENSHFLIFCGMGNNGGDGMVLARKLYSNGAHIQLYILSQPEKYKGAALENWNIIQRLNLPVSIMPPIEEIQSFIKPEHIVIDAIFGTGLTRDIAGYYFQVIQLLNQVNNPVISIDIPSGIHGDNGSIRGIAVQADYTVTFGLPKVGNILYPGYQNGGELYVSHISFPPDLYNHQNLHIYVNTPVTLPDRPSDGHKGTFGNVLFIAGAQQYYGAPYLSSLSFLKAGGGYSRLAAPAAMVPYISTKASEVVFLPQKETASGSISLANYNELLKYSETTDMVIIGPGLSLEEETQDLIRRLIIEIQKPLLIDGDGLTALSQDVSTLKKRSAPTILTPHLGEMARLINQPIRNIKENPIKIIQKFIQDNHVICVLKGAHSIIGLTSGEIYINMTGNSGMASAGSGDVLTGTIAAMFTLGLPLEYAVRQGTLVHGLAGDFAAHKKGEDGMTAEDVLHSLPKAIKSIRHNQNMTKQLNFSGFNRI